VQVTILLKHSSENVNIARQARRETSARGMMSYKVVIAMFVVVSYKSVLLSFTSILIFVGKAKSLP
jgi:hypothetical protein